MEKTFEMQENSDIANSNRSDFIKAFETGDWKTVETLINAVGVGSGERTTALEYAVTCGNYKIVEKLINEGIEHKVFGVNIIDCFLIMAAISGHEAVVKTLVLKGAELDEQVYINDEDDKTASFNELVERCSVSKGVSIAANEGLQQRDLVWTDKDRFFQALVREKFDVLYQLADKEAVTSELRTKAFVCASSNGNSQLMNKLFHVGVDTNFYEYDTLAYSLYEAALNKHRDAVKALLIFGADYKKFPRLEKYYPDSMAFIREIQDEISKEKFSVVGVKRNHSFETLKNESNKMPRFELHM